MRPLYQSGNSGIAPAFLAFGREMRVSGRTPGSAIPAFLFPGPATTDGPPASLSPSSSPSPRPRTTTLLSRHILIAHLLLHDFNLLHHSPNQFPLHTRFATVQSTLCRYLQPGASVTYARPCSHPRSLYLSLSNSHPSHHGVNHQTPPLPTTNYHLLRLSFRRRLHSRTNPQCFILIFVRLPSSPKLHPVLPPHRRLSHPQVRARRLQNPHNPFRRLHTPTLHERPPQPRTSRRHQRAHQILRAHSLRHHRRFAIINPRHRRSPHCHPAPLHRNVLRHQPPPHAALVLIPLVPLHNPRFPHHQPKQARLLRLFLRRRRRRRRRRLHPSTPTQPLLWLPTLAFALALPPAPPSPPRLLLPLQTHHHAGSQRPLRLHIHIHIHIHQSSVQEIRASKVTRQDPPPSSSSGTGQSRAGELWLFRAQFRWRLRIRGEAGIGLEWRFR